MIWGYFKGYPQSYPQFLLIKMAYIYLEILSYPQLSTMTEAVDKSSYPQLFKYSVDNLIF